jgi:uncharacterized protein with PQ loop repeat
MLEMFTAVVGSLMGLSFLLQTWRIYKFKRSEEVSILTFSWLLFGTITWLTYGVSISDPVIIVANMCGLIGIGSVLAITLRYRKK